MGFYVSGHPLAKYADRLRDLKAVELGTFESRRNNEEVAVAGIVVTIRSMRSRKGARWAILSLQDPTGMLEVLAFPESFAKLENVLKAGAMLLLRGRVQIEDAGTRLVVSDANANRRRCRSVPSLCFAFACRANPSATSCWIR